MGAIDYLDYLIIKSEIIAIFEKWKTIRDREKSRDFSFSFLENSQISSYLRLEDILGTEEGPKKEMLLCLSIDLKLREDDFIRLSVKVYRSGIFEITVHTYDLGTIERMNIHLKRIFESQILLRFETNKEKAWMIIFTILCSIYEPKTENLVHLVDKVVKEIEFQKSLIGDKS